MARKIAAPASCARTAVPAVIAPMIAKPNNADPPFMKSLLKSRDRQFSLSARSPRAAPGLFAVAVFLSAALVFTVEPLMARLVLPVLGGSAAVWNTSLVFFQAALLADTSTPTLFKMCRHFGSRFSFMAPYW